MRDIDLIELSIKQFKEELPELSSETKHILDVMLCVIGKSKANRSVMSENKTKYDKD